MERRPRIGQSVILFDPDFALGLTYFISLFFKPPLTDRDSIQLRKDRGRWRGVLIAGFSSYRVPEKVASLESAIRPRVTTKSIFLKSEIFENGANREKAGSLIRRPSTKTSLWRAW